MAHELDFSLGRAGMAYIGDTPWHGLGSVMQEGQSLDQWRVAAGLDWEAKKQKIAFWENGTFHEGDSNIIYRSDNLKELGVVSDDYRILQPKAVMDFYADLVEDHGFTMETAGSLHGGKRIWALARTGQDFAVAGRDTVKGYVLLATSFDKSLATRIQFTSVRVVCQNTLSMSYAGAAGKDFVSVPHSAIFDDRKVKLDLGIYQDNLKGFEWNVQKLANTPVSRDTAIKFLTELLATKDEVSTRKMNQIQDVYSLYAGRGMGSQLEGSAGTLWGLLNAVTEHVDHHAGRTANTRMNSAWFGTGAALKTEAFNRAIEMAA